MALHSVERAVWAALAAGLGCTVYQQRDRLRRASALEFLGSISPAKSGVERRSPALGSTEAPQPLTPQQKRKLTMAKSAAAHRAKVASEASALARKGKKGRRKVRGKGKPKLGRPSLNGAEPLAAHAD